MKYKMFVTDYDNTLLRTDGTILPQTWAAIKEYERRGGKFVIATGRMLSSFLKTVEPYGLTGELIAFQGGVVVDIESGDVLMKKYVDPVGMDLLKDLQAAGYYIQVYNNGEYFVNRFTKRTERYIRANDLYPTVVGEDVYGYVKSHNMLLDKIVFGLDDDGNVTDYAELERVMSLYGQKYAGKLVFNSSNTFLIEAISATATKREAVAFVAERHGIAPSEVICIGDALNDASMVTWAGLGVAVGNATHDLKEVADIVTVSCDEDAVGTIIKKYCLGDEE